MDFVMGGTLLVCCAMLWGYNAVMTHCMMKLRERVDYLEFILGVCHENDE